MPTKPTETTTLSLRLKPEMRDMLEEIADARGQSLTKVVERAIALAHAEMLNGKDSMSKAAAVTGKNRKK